MGMISAEECDRRFDDGEEILQYFDLENIQHPGLEWWVMRLEHGG